MNKYILVNNSKLTYLVSLFLVMFISSCSSCENKVSPTDVDAGVLVDAGASADAGVVIPPTPLEVKETVVKDNWELVLPFGSNKTFNPEKDIALTVMISDPSEIVLVLSKEDFSESYDEYLIHSLRGIRASGSEIISIKELNSNNQKFMEIESKKGSITVLNWITVKNNFGYTLSCGGSAEDAMVEDVCLEVFSSFQIN
jgi:hypothetical protein